MLAKNLKYIVVIHFVFSNVHVYTITFFGGGGGGFFIET